MKYVNFANSIHQDKTETLITLIDVSPSMKEKDWKPTRLAGAIQANEKLLKAKIKNHPKDFVGIIEFGGEAKLLHAPVCLEKGLRSLQRALKNPWTSSGTNFTAALALAERCLFGATPKQEGSLFSRMLSEIFCEPTPNKPQIKKGHKRIIMLTDGEHNQGGSPLKIAAKLKKAGVIIDCIGIGGRPEKIDEILLKQIASENPDGSVRYCFIGDQKQLLQEYQTLAHHIRAL
jgi:hypothetical protein